MHSLKTTVFTLIASFFILTGTGIGADVAKIAVVDFQRIFDTSDAGKGVKAEITVKGKKMEAILKEKGAEIEELKKRIEREALVMSKEMREEKEREFRIKVNDIKTLQKKFEAELQGIQKRLGTKIKKDVIKIVEEVGKTEGYLLIIEQLSVIYAPSTIDITDEIIKKYNETVSAEKKTKN